MFSCFRGYPVCFFLFFFFLTVQREHHDVGGPPYFGSYPVFQFNSLMVPTVFLSLSFFFFWGGGRGGGVANRFVSIALPVLVHLHFGSTALVCLSFACLRGGVAVFWDPERFRGRLPGGAV